ncbi:sensor histidine kinase [Facklamia miroungae]|nr:sensor histidine kinase [Facklamia miroungae]
MYIYDLIATILIVISHLLFYFQLIHYSRPSYMVIISLGTVFTLFLRFVIEVTGFPELNMLLCLLFLLSLGLLQIDLNFTKNLYFALTSIVIITLFNMALMELSQLLFMWSPFNLYIWTYSIIHLGISIIILLSVVMLSRPNQRLANFIGDSHLYPISFGLLGIGFILILILNSPATHFLASLNIKYWRISYNVAFFIFFILILLMLIGFQLTKEKLLDEHQSRLDKEMLDYVKKLEIMHDELARFRHDYKNLLLSLDEAVRTKNIIQIEQIYNEVIAPTSNMINNHELDITKLSYINIPEVKSILSVKFIAAQQHRMKVLIDIPKSIDSIDLPIVDFIRIISIIVDNAIEAAVESKEKIIQFSFFKIKETHYFIVRNSFKQTQIDLEKIYEKSYSTKNENRGCGLYSLKRIIDQTKNVTLETSLQEPFITQTIKIKDSNKENNSLI